MLNVRCEQSSYITQNDFILTEKIDKITD
uniref:Uncharacterized protein n=1 Tax=Anguilla anguilla TaxID=7936 RepID=A0A0E9SIC5_ANGAN